MLESPWRTDFPFFDGPNKNVVYLDSSASTQKPKTVIEKMHQINSHYYANINRGAYYLSEKMTDEYEGARKKIASFINSNSEKEIIFTKNCTESINLVASTITPIVPISSKVIITTIEHHANIVPWQLAAAKNNWQLESVPLKQNLELDWSWLERKFKESNPPKLLAITHASNVLGNIHDIKSICKLAHENNCRVLVDGAQAVSHLKINVQDLGCDFYVFTGHKLFASSGIGVLWGKYELLKRMPPYQGGGDMIMQVSLTKSSYQTPPHRFEAGTPPIVEAISLGYAIDYINDIDFNDIIEHKKILNKYFLKKWNNIAKPKGFKLIANLDLNRIAIFSFFHPKIHAHDLATIFDSKKIAVRTGHHCTMPLHDHLKIPASTRVSLSIYNNINDIEKFFNVIEVAWRFFNNG